MILPTEVVIFGRTAQGGDPVPIAADQIPAQHAEWFKQSLRYQYVTFSGHVYVVDDEFTYTTVRSLYLRPRPEYDTPDMEVSQLLVPFVSDILGS